MSNATVVPDLVIYNATLLTCRPGAEDHVGLIEGAAISVADGRILAVGTDVESYQYRTGVRSIDAEGRIVMPGFVDSHTHVVWGGSRVDEYAARVAGRDLEPLRQRGLPVGISGTVRETRDLSIEGLVEESLPRLLEMFFHGTTTVESKSGYALTLEGELRMLEANQDLAELVPVDIVSTFLGAHALPDDRSREQYVSEIVEEMIPATVEGGLATFCDVFCEEGYFTVEESRVILEAGLAHGLLPKIHLDQYAYSGAASMAAELGCVSADHLNFTPPDELRLLAEAGVVGMPLPGLDFSVAHPRPIDFPTLRDAGITIALATDICPGCWMPSMQTVIQLACRLHGMSVEEAIRASTIDAARAVRLEDEIGSLEPGKQADLLILDTDRYEDLAYRLGHNAVQTVVKRGEVALELPEILE